MQYLLLIYENETELGDDDRRPTARRCRRVPRRSPRASRRAGTTRAATRSSRRRRRRPCACATASAQTTDGPFAETREQLGGYYLVDAKDLDEAIGIAERIPGARTARSKCVRSCRCRRCERGRRSRRIRKARSRASSARSPSRVLATLIRLLGDFDAAEEALQDAFAAAVEQWERDGLPANPRAWLVSAGRHRAIDRMRRDARFAARVDEHRRVARGSATEPIESSTTRAASTTTGCG